MGKKGKCDVTNIGSETVAAVSNQKIQDVKNELTHALYGSFGKVKNTSGALKASIKQLKDRKKDVKKKKADLRKAKKVSLKSKKIKSLKDEIIEINRNLAKHQRNLKEMPEKMEIGKKLYTLLEDTYIRALNNSMFQLPVKESIKALKYFLIHNTGQQFNDVTELDKQSLNLAYNFLDKIFKQQKKGKVPKGFGKLRKLLTGPKQALMGAWAYTMQDPATIVLANDESLGGLALEQEILESLNNKSSKKQIMKNKYRLVKDDMKGLIYDNIIAYGLERPPVNPEKLSIEEEQTSLKNVNQLLSNLSDGRTKYTEFKSIKSIMGKGEHWKKYVKIVNYANKSGFHISKDIHEVVIGGETYYYVALKDIDDSTGRETYSAYLVPHYLDSLGRTRLRYPTNKKGNLVGINFKNDVNQLKKDLPDIMENGFYRAAQEKIYNGYNLKEKEIKTKGYANYQKIDLDTNHALFTEVTLRKGSKDSRRVSLWTILQDRRKVLEEVYDDTQAIGMDAYRIIESTSKKFPKIRDILIGKGEENPDDLISNISNILNFNHTFWLNEEGELEGPNMLASKVANYDPDMYEWGVRLEQLYKQIINMEDELVRFNDRVKTLKLQLEDAVTREERNDIKERIKRTNDNIRKYEGIKDNDGNVISVGLIEMFKAQKDLALGRIDNEDMPKMNVQNMMLYGKHKKLWTRRIKDETQEIGGKRTDLEVVDNYIDNGYESVYNNVLLAKLLQALPIVHPELLPYLVEEVKASFGRKDLESGIPFFDLSNNKLTKFVNKISPSWNLTNERLQEMAGNASMLVSGSLLRIGVSLQNRMQSVIGTIQEIGHEQETTVQYIMINHPELAQEIADKAGVQDTVQAIADLLMSNIETQVDVMDGMHGAKDLALLKGQNKLRFINQAKGIRSWALNKIKSRELGREEVSVDEINEVMEGIWEMTHGLSEGTISEEDFAAIEKKLNRVAVRGIIQMIAAWGMNAMGLQKAVPEAGPAMQFLSMVQGELEMRKWMAVRGAVNYADFIAKGEQRGKYTSPDALNAARVLVNNTMFQFSQQHFGKFFRGTSGAFFGKFKTYFAKQTKRELEIWRNFRLSMKGMSYSQISQEMRKLLLFPPKEMPVLGRLIGWDKDDIGSFNAKKMGMYKFFPWMDIALMDTPGVSNPTERARQLLWSRVITSVFTSGLMGITRPLLSKMRMWNIRKNSFDYRTLIGGVESPITTFAMRIFQVLLGSMTFGEEDDEDMTQVLRLIMPLYISAIVDGYKTGDPFRFTRIFTNWASDAANYLVNDVFNDEE